jgi:hypothetical protein
MSVVHCHLSDGMSYSWKAEPALTQTITSEITDSEAYRGAFGFLGGKTTGLPQTAHLKALAKATLMKDQHWKDVEADKLILTLCNHIKR